MSHLIREINEVWPRTVPCVTPEHDVGLEVGDDARLTVESLLRDGLEEEVHGLAEALLRPRGRSDRGPSPEAAGGNKYAYYV